MHPQEIELPSFNPKVKPIPTYSSPGESGRLSHTPIPQYIEGEEEDVKPKPPNKYIALLWLLWHTFDFITDVILGIEWLYGVEAIDKDDVFAIFCENHSNSILKLTGIIILISSVIGYLLYLYHAHKHYVLHKPLNINWNCAKIWKLILEDLVSFCTVTFVVFVVNFGEISVWGALSLLLSGLSFFIMMVKQILYNPCRFSKSCWDKCCGCICCVLLMAVLSAIVFIIYMMFHFLVLFAIIFALLGEEEGCPDNVKYRLDVGGTIFSLRPNNI